MNTTTDWQLYESRKAEIQQENLSPEEYEKRITELARELETEVED